MHTTEMDSGQNKKRPVTDYESAFVIIIDNYTQLSSMVVMIQYVSPNGLWCAALIALIMCHPSHSLTVNELTVTHVCRLGTSKDLDVCHICDRLHRCGKHRQN